MALSANLGRHPLLDPDEGRNAEVGREMMMRGDYLVPRLNALPYLDKPTLNFAAEAAAMRLLGSTATAARLPSLLFTFATVALLGWFAQRRFGGSSGIVAAVALASCPLAVAFSRIVIFDAALSFFVTLATIAFFLAVEEEPSRRWSATGWAAIALGVVTKGPVALLLPLLVAIPYGVWRKRGRRIWSWLGFALFLLILVPWIWAMSVAVPGFLEYALVTETMKRLATNELKRTGPPWYFIPYIFAGALPWVILLLSGVRRDEKEGARWNTTAVFGMLWVVLPLIFFSISKSKRPQYILPLMPGIALLVAWHWTRMRERLRGAATALLLYAILGGVLLGAVGGSYIKVRGGVQPPERNAAIFFGVVLLGSGVAGMLARRNRGVVFATLALPMLLIPIAVAPVLDRVANRRSSEQLAHQILAKHAVRRVYAVRAYSGSLSFYLQQPVVLLTDDASELTSNYLLRTYDKWISAPDTTLQRPVELARALQSCDESTVFVTEPREREMRSILAARLPLAARGNRLEAYGPCRHVAVAERQFGVPSSGFRVEREALSVAPDDAARRNSELRTPNSELETRRHHEETFR